MNILPVAHERNLSGAAKSLVTLANELINGLLNIFDKNIKQIILYGSVVRNTEKKDSDIDIAIILETAINAQTKAQFIQWAAEMDIKYDRIFSIIDIEKINLEKWGDTLPFYKSVFQEGIVLWTAA